MEKETVWHWELFLPGGEAQPIHRVQLRISILTVSAGKRGVKDGDVRFQGPKLEVPPT